MNTLYMKVRLPIINREIISHNHYRVLIPDSTQLSNYDGKLTENALNGRERFPDTPM